jgi:putative tricarboxylic transport membrane protein
VNKAMLDVWYMLIFGVIGYVFKKLDYPLAPLVLALVLGDMTETAVRQSLIMSQGSLGIFFTRPIAAVITSAALLILFSPALLPLLRRARRTLQRARPEPAAALQPGAALAGAGEASRR